MIKNKELLRYTQLQDSASKRCLGTVSASAGTLGLVDCNERDPLQFWDMSDVYASQGVLRKPYNVSKSVDIADFDITIPELSNGTLGEQITIAQGTDGTYSYTSQPWGTEPANGLVSYNPMTKALRGIYRTSNGDNRDTCVNTQGSSYASRIGANGNKTYARDEANVNQQCDTKWNALVKSCGGAAPTPGHQCDRATGEYVCKPGFFGKNCDFRSTTATTPADAYDNFFNACYEGNAAYENPSLLFSTLSQSCTRLNNQTYIPEDLAGQFYDVVTKTNNKFADTDFSNKRKLVEADGQYDRDYTAHALYVNTELTKFDEQSATANNTNTATLAAQRAILTTRQAANDALAQQVASPQVPNETIDPIKSLKSNNAIAQATARGSLAAKNGELGATKNKIAALQKTLEETAGKISNFVDACRRDGLLCTIRNA
jgi:hypothetical protein